MCGSKREGEGDRWRESVDTRSYLTPLTCVKLFTSATRQKNQTKPKFCSFALILDLWNLHGSGLVSVDGFYILNVHHFVSCSPHKHWNWSRPILDEQLLKDGQQGGDIMNYWLHLLFFTFYHCRHYSPHVKYVIVMVFTQYLGVNVSSLSIS